MFHFIAAFRRPSHYCAMAQFQMERLTFRRNHLSGFTAFQAFLTLSCLFNLILPTLCRMSNPNTPRVLITGSFDSGLITGHAYDPKTRQFTHLWTSSESSPGPSWQSYIPSSQLLYSVSEGLSQAQGGGIDVYEALTNGFGGLKKIGNASSVYEPVSIAILGDLLVSASYAGSGVNSYTINPDPRQDPKEPPIRLQQRFKYSLAALGTNPIRQDTAHPHQARIDPTGQFVVVPDLGADLLRLYTIGHGQNDIYEFTNKEIFGDNPPGNIKVKGGFGPRHGIFWPSFVKGTIYNPEIETGPKEAKYFYVVGELANEVIAYCVSYGKSLNGREIIQFKELQTITSFGVPENIPPKNDTHVPNAAEIAISPDSRFLYVSNRYDAHFKPNPNNASATMDSIVVYSIDNETGLLSFIQLTPSGGSVPRHFTINSLEGGDQEYDYITVANQLSSNVAVYRRDRKTGKVEEEIWAGVGKEGGIGSGPTCVTWL